MSQSIETIKTFLSKYNHFEVSRQSQKIKEDIDSYKSFFNNFKPINMRWQVGLKATAPYYNLFSVLNIRHYETYVHTPFLKHLLTPTETHQQDRLFFDYFMQQILGERFQNEQVKYIQVYEEYPFSNGRIDILIRFQMNDKPFGLVIENKIYHHDEHKQLERYYEYLTQVCGLPVGQYHLVYLKPHQGSPSNYSIDAELYHKLKSENAITEIGYHQHIAPWLQQLLTHIEPLSVKQIILQYIQTIKSL